MRKKECKGTGVGPEVIAGCIRDYQKSSQKTWAGKILQKKAGSRKRREENKLNTGETKTLSVTNAISDVS